MTNNLIQTIDEMIAVEEKGIMDDYPDFTGTHAAAINALETIKLLAIAEQKHQENWKARFMELRAKHEGMMKAEQERIIKKLTDYFGEDESDGQTCECDSCLSRNAAIKIVKNE